MAQVLKNLNAVDAAITFNISEDQIGGVFSLQYPTGGIGTIVVEATLDDITWEALTFVKSSDTASTLVASAAAAGLFIGDIPACAKIRARKSLNAGACIVGFSVGTSY